MVLQPWHNNHYLGLLRDVWLVPHKRGLDGRKPLYSNLQTKDGTQYTTMVPEIGEVDLPLPLSDCSKTVGLPCMMIYR